MSSSQPGTVGFLSQPSAETSAMLQAQLPSGWRLVSSNGGSDQPAFRAMLPEIDYLVVSATRLDRSTIGAAPRLRFVHKLGVGYDDVDIGTMAERGIALAVSPIGTIEAVAEHTLALILAALKVLVPLDHAVRVAHGWPKWESRGRIRQLSRQTVGIVGFGRIGRAVAALLAGFGSRLLVHARAVPSDLPDGLAALAARGKLDFTTSLPELFAAADVVTLHLPLGPDTRGLIGESLLAVLGPEGLLVNTSRGAIIDETALYRVLADGRLGGAALDVLSTEPPLAGMPLLELENVLISPHIAGGGLDVIRSRIEFVMGNLVAFHEGRPVREGIDISLPTAG